MTRTCVFESFWDSFSALRTLKVIQFAISWLNSLLSSFVRGRKTETADTIVETARGSADAQGREGRYHHQLLPRLLGQHQRPREGQRLRRRHHHPQCRPLLHPRQFVKQGSTITHFFLKKYQLSIREPFTIYTSPKSQKSCFEFHWSLLATFT